MATKYTKKHTGKVLERYKRILAEEIKRQLNKPNSNLSKSIQGIKLRGKDGFGIYMNEYGIYKNSGVNGTQSAYSSPYSYKVKWPNIDKIKDWIVRNNVTPKTFKSTKLSELEDLSFLIARSIYKNGIRPTRFIDIAIEKVEPKMTIDLANAYLKDLSEPLDKATPTAKKG
tara:strand:+ start:861 stop:1373 length:513 start_codon:yes stop_codon:yes gene_type:complete